MRPSMRSLPLLILLSAIVVGAWWFPNRLQDPGAGTAAQKFSSLSYAGYRNGDSPRAERFATAAEVDQDMALLAPVTRAIRTYAAFEGPYDVPAIAQRHGLHVWQGIWLGGDRAQNAREMARGIALANRYPDTIERVVVGNEVLLRRDLPPAELIAAIDHVRASVRQHVAYADVPEFWTEFPEVARHVDLVLIHLLPYWDDTPTGIDRAVAAVGAAYDQVAAMFPGKQVAIGETCWPSRGRQRRDAVPSRINEARFLRGFLALAAARGIDYNFIEAFDQTWKYENEGIVGANWGLFTAARAIKIAPSGPLREDPDWAAHAAVSVACGLLLSALGLAARRPGAPSTRAQTMLLGMTLGAAWGWAEAETSAVLYDVHVWLAAIVDLAGQGLLAALMMLRSAGALAPADWRTGADATRRITQMLRLRRPNWPGAFEDLTFLFAWTACVQQILLVFDPRYRDFPVTTFAVPLVVTAARAAGGDLPRGVGGREEWAVALTLSVGAIASAVQEGALNGQSLRWNACALVLSLPFWISVTRTRPAANTPVS